MKKIISLILVAMTLVACLAGCGSKQETPPTQGGTESTTAAKPAEAIEIVLWHTLTDHHQEALDKIIADFNAAQTPRAVLLDVGDHIWYDYSLDGAEFPENGLVAASGFRFEGEQPAA